MSITEIIEKKIPIVLTAFGLVSLHILWDYFNGGVPTHYVLADDDLPGISNWWGILTVPLTTWIALFFTQKRLAINNKDITNVEKRYTKVMKNFLGGLLFGVIIAFCWEIRNEEILQYLIYFPLIISLFIPVYYTENLLGFFFGMIYTFGGVLPIGIGLFLLILSFLVHKIIRGGILFLIKKMSN